MTTTSTTCVTEGCTKEVTAVPVLWGDAEAALCDEHVAAFLAQPTDWDGELSPDGRTVVRLWRRQGVGEAS
ncbi:MAG TPA: hypothetical protein VKV06_11260 [Acidimicrobiales bacterium]|nr:hypothetical protein [Acidimicrobiales bacterium]